MAEDKSENNSRADRLHELFELTPPDLLPFFKSVNAEAACPVCATRKWTAFRPQVEGLGLIKIAHDFEPKLTYGPYVSVLIVSCNNCGFIRLHSAGVIAEWKAKLGVPRE